MQKPSIVYFGTPDFSAVVLERLLAEQLPVVGVVSTPEKPAIRTAMAEIKTPVARLAAKRGIRVLTPSSLRNNSALVTELTELNPDLILVFSYGKIIPDTVLSIPTKGALNIHPSLLPKFRGPSPLQAQILAGEPQTGSTIITMTQAIDAGDIVAQQAVPMPKNVTFLSLAHDLAHLSADMLIELMPHWCAGDLQTKPQDHTQATFTKLVTKDDGFIDLADPSLDLIQVDRKIRAYHPWPGCWTIWEGKRLKFLPQGMIQAEGKAPVVLKQFLAGHQTLQPALSRLFLSDEPPRA